MARALTDDRCLSRRRSRPPARCSRDSRGQGTVYSLGGRRVRRERSRAEMTIATMPRGVRMRPIASPDDSFTAAAILAQAATDDLDAFRELVPSGTTPNPVEIAEDGSAAIFEVYVGTDWDAHRRGAPIARIIVRR